jgi:cytochrome c biogenesis protein CcdA
LEAGASGSVVTVDGGTCDEEGCIVEEQPFMVNVPFYGPIDAKKFSLPVMSLVLGFIDGFNPCAMWVLVTFLIVLIQIGDRKKMWQIAGLFILAEAIMYYLILNVWFTAWDFIGLDRIVTPIIGLLAIGGGIFFLYEYWTSDGTCKVTNPEQRKKIHGKIKDIAEKPMTLAVAAGVIVLALSVNIIEFACSIGIPQAFTKIIEINNLSFLQTQGLMFLYIIMYMVDDLIVFGLALWGAQHLAMTSKYARWCNLIGGLLMVVLGLLLIFAPDVLRF